MAKRDLKKDWERLVELETEEQNARDQRVAFGNEDVETRISRTQTNRMWFAGCNGPHWLRRALAEEERALKAEALAQELVEALGKAIEECYHPICGPGSVVDEVEDTLAKAKEALGDDGPKT